MVVFVLMFMPSLILRNLAMKAVIFLTKIFKGAAKSAEHYANKP